MTDSARVAGVAVLFYPGADVFENIASYLDQVEFLLLVDNTPRPDHSLVDRLRLLPRVEYEACGENRGVAWGLNRGAARAVAAGCHFLLTMDQDSRATPGMVSSLLAGFGAGVGIVAPFLVTRHGEAPPSPPACREVETAMTSGSLLSLAAYAEAGPFLDSFFIDFVDVEYCLRLRRAGFRIVEAGEAVLHHAVGEKIGFRIGSRAVCVTTHAPVRSYYKTRNRLFVGREYRETFPAFCRRDRRRFLLEIGRLLLFEREKMPRLAFLWRGWLDYRRGRLGPLPGKGNTQ